MAGALLRLFSPAVTRAHESHGSRGRVALVPAVPPRLAVRRAVFLDEKASGGYRPFCRNPAYLVPIPRKIA